MEKIKSVVNNELVKINNLLKNSVNKDNDIKNEVYNFLNSNSKRIRSILAILYLKSNGINLTDNLAKVITAAELIHNASLLHDDVIDNAIYRRGDTTIAEKFSSKISILCGDYLVSAAVELLSQINNIEILDIFAKCTKKMCNAEIEQQLFSGQIPELIQYINIIEGKTASLFSALLEACAILTDKNRKIAQSIGNMFGIIFQINNDMETDSAQNDKENGINTVVNILGIENAKSLKDNYKEEYRAIILLLPDNVYRNKLEDLVNLL